MRASWGWRVVVLVAWEDLVTSSEWQQCSDPRRMLKLLRGKVSNRKLRLFAVACCRQHDEFMFKPGCRPKRSSVEIAELFADGDVSETELQIAREEEDRQWSREQFPDVGYDV